MKGFVRGLILKQRQIAHSVTQIEFMMEFTLLQQYLNYHFFFTSFKVFFVNPVDLKSVELLNIANELLQNSFPVRYGTLAFHIL